VRFISVTKPGIIVGNVITVTGGFFLGLQARPFNFVLFIATLLGMSCVMAAGCVFNNCIDRDIDALMERTKNRVMVSGLISLPVAMIYAVCLALLGALVLLFWTNLLTVIVALCGLFFYVVVYSLWAKRHSVYGTAIGGIAGSVPPVVGYCAVTNRLDLGAAILFALLFFWQMPHSYAIAIYRLKDYKAAAIPVLPVKKGAHAAKVSMLIFVILFLMVAVLPFLFHLKGLLYLIVAGGVSVWWLYHAVSGFFIDDIVVWARKFFLTSVIVITAISLVMIA
jgi:heme o synthase